MSNGFDDDNVVIFGLVIDHKCNVIPMGSLYDSIEYFLKIYETNKDIKLLFHLIPNTGFVDRGSTYKRFVSSFDFILKQVRDIIEGKYYISDFLFFDNIHIVDIKHLFMNNRLNKILTIDLTSPQLFKSFIARSREVYIIPEWTKREYFYQSKRNNVTYYTEMPFCYCDVPYRMKFDFDRYKPIDKYENKLYVNYPKLNPFDELKIKNEIDKFDKDVLVKEDQFFYDLHLHFNEYVYFQSVKWFDPHPKLFHECKFYNKPYHYFNFNNVKDGSYYRYKWSLTDKLSDLQLTKDDIIVKIMSE